MYTVYQAQPVIRILYFMMAKYERVLLLDLNSWTAFFLFFFCQYRRIKFGNVFLELKKKTNKPSLTLLYHYPPPVVFGRGGGGYQILQKLC